MTTFQGQDGRIVIEAESAQAVGDWRQTRVDGETALLWDPETSNYRTVDPSQTLSYNFVTDERGEYHIGLNSARVGSVLNADDRYENGRSGEVRTDTGNDVYVAVIDVATGDVVRAPTKLFTYFGDADEQFRTGFRFDENHNQYEATVDLDANREYRLEITGRSDGYALDKITLNKGSLLRDNNLPESAPVEAPAPEPVVVQPPANEAPVARNDTARTDHDTSFSVDVLSNDRDPDGGRLTITDVSYNGDTALVSVRNGEIFVNPLSRATEERVETIRYTVRDEDGATDTATLRVTVGAEEAEEIVPVNSAPDARNDAAETIQNRTITVDVLANDRDADGGSLTLTDVHYSGDTSLVSIENGVIKVNPLSAFTHDRTETIRYTVRDEDGATDTATLSVDITGGTASADILGRVGQDDVLRGTDAGETINGRGGEDNVYGNGGNDVFVFTDTSGSNDLLRIKDFEVGVDAIDLNGAEVLSANQYSSGEGLWIRLDTDDRDALSIPGVTSFDDLTFL